MLAFETQNPKVPTLGLIEFDVAVPLPFESTTTDPTLEPYMQSAFFPLANDIVYVAAGSLPMQEDAGATSTWTGFGAFNAAVPTEETQVAMVPPLASSVTDPELPVPWGVTVSLPR